jgi:RNA polymerase sigma-70 factor, ECF subfamily
VYGRAVAGDARAYAEILRAYRPRFLRYATRMLEDRDAAEDVAQEAFVRAFRALPQCAGPDSLESWMFSILANRCRTALAKRARHELLFARFHDQDDGEAVADPMTPHMDVTARQVEQALDTLSAEQREAFLMRHVEEMGYDEMARVTGAGVSALKMRVSRARELMRAHLAEDV